jgi:hypothetical protein
MEQMMTRKQPVFLAAAILGFAALAASSETSLAQSIPVPTPAPQAKTGQVPPPPSALAQQRPPAAIPSAPAANNAAPGGKATIIGNKENAGGGFDAKQRALATASAPICPACGTMVGDFVQVGPDGSKDARPGLSAEARPRALRICGSVSDRIDRRRVIRRGARPQLATQDLYPLSQTPLRFLLADKIGPPARHQCDRHLFGRHLLDRRDRGKARHRRHA